MKILSASQIRALDQYTIEQEPITSIDLMERASLTFVNWFVNHFPSVDQPVHIYCGIGNNGGDGLAVARLLYRKFYPVKVYLCKISENLSADCKTNLDRLPKDQAIPIIEIQKENLFPTIEQNSILIDAIFGSGLNRPVSGYWASLVDHLNKTYSTIVSIDIPSENKAAV